MTEVTPLEDSVYLLKECPLGLVESSAIGAKV